MTNRPLVLLDVDGVINDLVALWGGRRPWETRILRSHGYLVHVPDFMPALIQHLARIGEIHWCTTWRDRANDQIAPFLGVGPLPVIDDGTRRCDVGWKARAASGLVSAALASGRRVLWIEDFYGAPPVDALPAGVEFIDTAAAGEQVLLLEHLPADLRPAGEVGEAA